MSTAIEFPEPLYRQGQQAARLRGVSIEELAIRALEHELSATADKRNGGTPVSLPLIPSKNPGVLDLNEFDFDDLLA